MTLHHNNHLILMLKTPKLGSVKTRLAASIGNTAATAFYRCAANRLIFELSRDSRWLTFLAITPDADLHRWPWPAHARLETQGKGNLGDRMLSLFKSHAPNKTLIIGTDIPSIKPAHINDAFQKLGRHEVVLGPSGDGGYWCVGQNNRRKTLKFFKGVRWSSRYTLDDTMANLQNQNITCLRELKDIDEFEDYKTHRQTNKGRWIV